MADLDFGSLLMGSNLLLTGGAFAATTAAKEMFKNFFSSVVGQRFLPVMPLAFGVIGAQAGVCEGASTWQGRCMIGLIAGFTAGHTFKVGKTSVMGSGVEAPEPTPTTSTPTPPTSISSKEG
jgi:hypothetical protein